MERPDLVYYGTESKDEDDYAFRGVNLLPR
jgi:hypothetical protein